jgi:hypothetical protein
VLGEYFLQHVRFVVEGNPERGCGQNPGPENGR